MAKLFTDYPFKELGDKPFSEAPIREILFHSYDGNKYCKISVLTGNEQNPFFKTEIKLGYIYLNKARLENAVFFSPSPKDIV